MGQRLSLSPTKRGLYSAARSRQVVEIIYDDEDDSEAFLEPPKLTWNNRPLSSIGRDTTTMEVEPVEERACCSSSPRLLTQKQTRQNKSGSPGLKSSSLSPIVCCDSSWSLTSISQNWLKSGSGSQRSLAEEEPSVKSQPQKKRWLKIKAARRNREPRLKKATKTELEVLAVEKECMGQPISPVKSQFAMPGESSEVGDHVIQWRASQVTGPLSCDSDQIEETIQPAGCSEENVAVVVSPKALFVSDSRSSHFTPSPRSLPQDQRRIRKEPHLLATFSHTDSMIHPKNVYTRKYGKFLRSSSSEVTISSRDVDIKEMSPRRVPESKQISLDGILEPAKEAMAGDEIPNRTHIMIDRQPSIEMGDQKMYSQQTTMVLKTPEERQKEITPTKRRGLSLNRVNKCSTSTRIKVPQLEQAMNTLMANFGSPPLSTRSVSWCSDKTRNLTLLTVSASSAKGESDELDTRTLNEQTSPEMILSPEYVRWVNDPRRLSTKRRIGLSCADGTFFGGNATTTRRTHSVGLAQPKLTRRTPCEPVYDASPQLISPTAIQVYSYRFWIVSDKFTQHVFKNPADRRIESIGRLSDCRIRLTKRCRRNTRGFVQQMVNIVAPSGSALRKCCKLLDDKFPTFYASSGLLVEHEELAKLSQMGVHPTVVNMGSQWRIPGRHFSTCSSNHPSRALIGFKSSRHFLDTNQDTPHPTSPTIQLSCAELSGNCFSSLW